MSKNHEWKADLDFYDDIRALTFETDEGIDEAIGLLWTKELRHCPHDLAGGDTVVVPAEAVAYFKKAGLKFTNNDLLRHEDFSEEELNEMRGGKKGNKQICE